MHFRLSGNGILGAVTIVAIVAGAGLILWLPDAVHHDDDLTHYQIAHWSWSQPQYLLDRWGRPGFTILYAAAAQAGWIGAKLFSLAIGVAIAFLTAGVARELGLARPWLAGVLVWAQPLFFRLSTTTLTELPAALYLIAALFLFFRGNLIWASLVFGLQFVTRHELVALAPVWMASLGWKLGTAGRPGEIGWKPMPWAAALGACVAMGLPLLAVNAVSAATGLGVPAEVFASARTNLDYGFGTPLTYFGGAAIAFGAVVGVLAVLGSFEAGKVRGLWLIVALAACYFGVHSALRALNLFATGGYPRFLVTIAPLVGLLAAAGWERAVRGPEWTPMWLAAVGAAMLMAMGFAWETLAGILDLGGISTGRFWTLFWAIVAQLALTIGWVVASRFSRARIWFAAAWLALAVQWTIQAWPEENPWTAADAKEVVRWMDGRELRDRPVLTTDPWVKYYLGIETGWGEDLRKALADAEAGTLFVYDRNYGPSDAYRLREDEVGSFGRFFEMGRFGATKDDGLPRIVVWEKR